jgi:hypothetical protein
VLLNIAGLSGEETVRIGERSRDLVRRDCAKLVRFNANELRIVMERARLAGRPVACFIRESALGSSTRARKTEATDSIIRSLSRVATRLGALSHIATEQRLDGAEEFQHAVTEVLGIIRHLD